MDQAWYVSKPMKQFVITSLLAVAVLASAWTVRADAVIEGLVQLPAPKPFPLAGKRYKTGGIIGTMEPPVAVVYLEGAFAAGKVTTNQFQITHKNLQFGPTLLPVQRGALVQFVNLDDEFHHVVSISKAKRFDLGRYRKDEPQPTVLFDQAGVIELGCEIHEHMRGYILVLDTPHFVKTDREGKFHLAGLPPGNYTLKAWINSRTIRSQTVELKDGARLAVNFPAP